VVLARNDDDGVSSSSYDAMTVGAWYIGIANGYCYLQYTED